MRRLVTSNSFTRSQVRLIVRLFNALLQGRDVTFYFRSPDFGAVFEKFKTMYDKWEENERKKFAKRKNKNIHNIRAKDENPKEPQGVDSLPTCENDRDI